MSAQGSPGVPVQCPRCGGPVWFKAVQGPGVARVEIPLECGPGGSPGGVPDIAADPGDAARCGRFLIRGSEAAWPEQRWEQHMCPAPAVQERQRGAWKAALSAQARAARNRRGRRPRPDAGPGMMRRSR
jgi:hypothetical protein